ncbi:MAG: 30S ribosomal protein S9 [Patescibacteria group bacterium]|nr:30S ribosomal protein S9 [Patescibacteria group bacterium]MCL5224407.1 30S ribosomal protein S9 [Patescibacteria group bacterium]
MAKETKSTTKTSTARKAEPYFEGIGRRKEAIARVRFYPAKAQKSSILVNERDYKSYFPILRLQIDLANPLKAVRAVPEKFGVSALVSGGGLTAQEEAIRLGLARALIKFSPEARKDLKVLGLLSRDARVVERKKYGLRKARRATQWKKR